jgi:hypothetical protein
MAACGLAGQSKVHATPDMESTLFISLSAGGDAAACDSFLTSL